MIKEKTDPIWIIKRETDWSWLDWCCLSEEKKERDREGKDLRVAKVLHEYINIHTDALPWTAVRLDGHQSHPLSANQLVVRYQSKIALACYVLPKSKVFTAEENRLLSHVRLAVSSCPRRIFSQPKSTNGNLTFGRDEIEIPERTCDSCINLPTWRRRRQLVIFTSRVSVFVITCWSMPSRTRLTEENESLETNLYLPWLKE